MRSKARVHSIDYFRGLMAVGIMVYHFCSEIFGRYSADSLLGRVGIYGVSVFYIISGISMSLAYSEMKMSPRSLCKYWIKRFFRIAPLFWVSSLATLFLWFHVNPSLQYDWWRYLANFSLLFGFYDLKAYIPMGGWSIGNEVFFYAFFPLLVFSLRSRLLTLAATILFFSAYCYFAFSIINPSGSMATEWLAYINPLNQMLLFVLGVIAGAAYVKGLSIREKPAVIIFLFSSILFVFYPVSGEQINIVTSWNRILFTAFILFMCWSLIYIQIPVGSFVEKTMRLMGEWSYSIYLIHGAVMFYLLRVFSPMVGIAEKHEKFMLLVFLGLPATLLLSAILYKFLEKPMISVGKKVTGKM